LARERTSGTTLHGETTPHGGKNRRGGSRETGQNEHSPWPRTERPFIGRITAYIVIEVTSKVLREIES